MYNETLYEVERVVQIRWVKSNILTIQTDNTALSSGEDMMINTTPGNPKITSPSATTMKHLKKEMMILSIKKNCLIAIQHLTTTRLELKRNLLQISALRHLKLRRRKTILSWKSIQEDQRLVIICSPLINRSKRSIDRYLISEKRVI